MIYEPDNILFLFNLLANYATLFLNINTELNKPILLTIVEKRNHRLRMTE